MNLTAPRIRSPRIATIEDTKCQSKHLSQISTDNSRERKDPFDKANSKSPYDRKENVMLRLLRGCTLPRDKYSLPKEVECAACKEVISYKEAIALPCGHFYDSSCLQKFFLGSLKNPSLMPPRCCKREIPLRKAKAYLTKDDRKRYCLKQRELTTLDPLYCSETTCSQWIPPEKIDKKARVGVCSEKHKTCTICKQASHRFITAIQACRQTWKDQEATELFRQNGWQQCPRCRFYVERNEGCRHIYCRCHYEFCYGCGGIWEKCKDTCIQQEREPIHVVSHQ